jgi:hypothetical protein
MQPNISTSTTEARDNRQERPDGSTTAAGPAFAHGPPRQEVLPDNCMAPHLPASTASALRAQDIHDGCGPTPSIANACLLNSLSLPAIVPTV